MQVKKKSTEAANFDAIQLNTNLMSFNSIPNRLKDQSSSRVHSRRKRTKIDAHGEAKF